MTDEQVWEDLSRFAQAMKRVATVILANGEKYSMAGPYYPQTVSSAYIKHRGGIREIIEPPQKKVRPLNAEEWDNVVGCITPGTVERYSLVLNYTEERALDYAKRKATCHPPGFPNDVRKLWEEE